MPLIVAAAQFVSLAGDVSANLAKHLQFMQCAADHGVQLLVFPELSLTGYERELAQDLAILPDDARLMPLRKLAQDNGMSTVVGVPLQTGEAGRVYIGALVLHGDGSMAIYTKQHLHGGEELVFAAGEGGALVCVGQHQIALAVCADATHASHAAAAALANPAVYAVGSVISDASYATESAQLAGYAAAHGMAVLLANFGGATGGWACAGRSAIWAPGGREVVAAPGLGERLVMGTRVGDTWSGSIVELQD